MMDLDVIAVATTIAASDQYVRCVESNMVSLDDLIKNQFDKTDNIQLTCFRLELGGFSNKEIYDHLLKSKVNTYGLQLEHIQTLIDAETILYGIASNNPSKG